MCDHDINHSRRDFLKLMGIFAGTATLPIQASLAQNKAKYIQTKRVRIGYIPITDATPLLVAYQNKFFERQGLQVDPPILFRSWAQLIEAFLSDSVNVIHLLSPMAVWTRFGSHFPAKIVAWNHVGGSALTVAQNINSLKDLGGKQVAIPFWYSVHNIVLQEMLRNAGLKVVTKQKGKLAVNEVGVIVLSPSDMPPALLSKQISGYLVAEPFNAIAEHLKIGKILRFTGDVWKKHACCVVYMHEMDLQQYPEWSQKVVNGIVEAQLWCRSHRAEVAKLISREHKPRLTPHIHEIISQVVNPAPEKQKFYATNGAIKNLAWQDHRIDFQPYPFESYMVELIKRMRNTQVEGNPAFLKQLNPTLAARQLVDDRFVKKAIQKLGGMKAFGLAEAYTRQEVFQL